MSIACIFGMGGNSVIARLLGENKKEEAGKALNFCVYATVAAGLITLILGLIFLKPIAHLIGAGSDNMAYTCDYLKYIFIGTPFIMIANAFIHIFRSAGLIKQSTTGLILGNAINIILDFVFIVIMNMGTADAALATSIGFLCATVYYFGCMLNQERKGNELILLSPKSFDPDKKRIKDIVAIGIPGALITVLMSVSNIVLNNYIGIYGSNAVASYGIAYKIDLIPILLSVGLCMGVGPLIGYYYGAKELKRMSHTLKLCTLYAMILGAFFTTLFLLFSRQLASVFMHDDYLINQTAYFLKVLCLSAPLLGIINMSTSYFQALGKAVNSLIITVLRNIVLFIPGVMILNSIWQLNGVIAAQPVVEVVLTIICLVMYAKDCPRNETSKLQLTDELNG